MVVTPGNMFGCYDSYAYRLWSLANVWTNCQFPLAATAAVKTEPPGSEGGGGGGGGGDNAEFLHIECPQCRKGYPGFQALRDHVEAAHPPPTPAPGSHACMQCSATFAHRDQLEKHELLHSPNATVSCKVCNKTFANVYRLQRHMISHDESAGLRKFKCPECDKAFKFKHHLKEHIRIHSGEKPFECANCGKRFSHSGSYSSHMTSKKCLVMNLKVGRGRGPSNNGSLLDKCLQGRGPKRPGPSLNNNHFAPILPKYATAYRGAPPYPGANQPPPGPLPHPYYMAPTSPYKLPASAYHLIHQLSAGVPPPYAAAAAGQHLLQHHYQQQQQLTPTEESTESRHRIGTETNSGDKSMADIANVAIKQEMNDEAAAAASASGDIEMEDGSQPPASPDSPVEGGGSDLEAVNRILETVNASVTKQSLEAHVLKQQHVSSPTTTATSCSSSASSSSSSSSVGSASSPLTINNNNNVESLSCRYCHKRLPSPIDLHQHETYLCCASGAISATVVGSEGLAAKLEDVMAAKTEEMSINGGSGSEDDECRGGGGGGDDSGSARSGGSKVRVRSLIADEQLLILKQNYAANPRPKKDELARIADLIKFPVRVVQVWFQNTRARDRREGRLVHVPYLPSLSPPVPSYPVDQPLDLSLKRASTPSSDGDGDAVNLSRKSNSPASHHFGRSPSPLSVFSFASETPGSKLARILQQPPTPRGMSTVPLDRLAESPLFGLQNGGGSSSPSSDKRSWKQGYLDGGDTTDEADDSGCTDLTLGNVADDIDAVTKRHRLLLALGGGGVVKLGSMLPGAGSAVDGEPEGQFICDQCDKAFSKQSSLARHKYEHSGQRPHKCDVCTKAFKHKHHLTEHKRLHSGEKPFQCMKCLKRFSHSGSYSQHMNHRYSYCKPYRE